MFVAVDDKLAGFFGVADSIKDFGERSDQELHRQKLKS